MDKFLRAFDTFLRTGILAGFTALLLWLIITNQVHLYINPKFEIMTQLAALVLAIMTVIQGLHSFSGSQNVNHNGHNLHWTYVPFLIVLALALFIPNNTLNANLADAKGLNANLVISEAPNPVESKNQQANYSSPDDQNPIAINNYPAIIADSTDTDTVKAAAPDFNKPKVAFVEANQPKDTLVEADRITKPAPIVAIPPTTATVTVSPIPKYSGAIIITQENYVHTIYAIYQNPSEYLGREISIQGSVYNKKGISNNQFVIMRYMITCCAADATAYGLVCEPESASKYSQGTWLSLRGILTMGKSNGKNEIIIKVSSLEKVEKPDDPYVYLLGPL